MPGALAHEVSTVDLVDETFVVVAPVLVAARIADPASWRKWWPDLHLTVFQDRGVAGIRWNVTGALTGSCELWLEPVRDGTVIHYFLRGTSPKPLTVRSAMSERARRTRAWKQVVFALKDQLEAGRVLQAPARTGRQPST